MPELPEVETTVKDLNIKVLNRTFIDVWTDFPKMIRLRRGCDGQINPIRDKFLNGVKKSKDFQKFRQEIKGKKIQNIWRRGKNILFDLSRNKTLLIHQKLTGHLLLGKWKKEKKRWKAATPGPLAEDPTNRFLHLIFWLDDGKMLALSDLRKFAKIELWNSNEFKKSEEFKSLGPEPLEKYFTLKRFKEILNDKKGKIKQVLMDQTVIAGIGNIYSDEILWAVKIHPFKKTSKLSEPDLKRIYQAMQKILKKAIKLKGDSAQDYRLITGERGGYQNIQKVYRQEGKPCSRCGTKIKRVKLAGRSAHYCPKCQKNSFLVS